MQAANLNQAHFTLASALKLGPPTLRVRELDGVLDFYEKDIGLQAKERYAGPDGLELIELGFKQKTEPLLILKHDPAATRPPNDFAGLYHYAVLLPERKDLASTFLGVGNSGVAYEGYADHTFSEAIYLHDPERNGMEFYADRPRNTWPNWNDLAKGGAGSQQFASLNGPLDLGSLLRELTSRERTAPISFPHGATVGHMHLRVTDLERSVEFYHSKLGFDITMYFPEIGAAFLSVDGYHHHLGLNTWHSKAGSAHRQGEIGLEELKIMLPSTDDVAAIAKRFPEFSPSDRALTIKDPDGIAITLES
ncbi:MAG: VOC family protein [Nitrososphaerales archaeon]|jgi:catechol 2,3-dioxygenase